MDLVELIRATAENQYKLMMAIADHIEKIEQELDNLKEKQDDPQRAR